MNKSKSNYYAQGTIEYLVIIAIVVIIALVVVGLLTGFLSSGDSVNLTSSDIKNKVGVNGISLVESVASLDSNGLFVLKNIGSETITVNKIVVNDIDHNYSEQIVFGEQESFMLQDINSCDGTKKIIL